MILDLEGILALLAVFTGIVVLVDYVLTRQQRKTLGNDMHYPWLIDWSRALFPVLIAVLIIRSFIVQPYRVPTGSLEPTVMPGDLILVNQYEYGFHLPVWHTEIMKVSKPKRGQIVLFRWPVNPGITFVKRLVGMPGDHISYVNKVLTINGKEAKQTFVKNTEDREFPGQHIAVKEYREDLKGVEHNIWRRADMPGKNFKDLVVPPGHYFMMGDNRDGSDDSRGWGFVPKDALIGRAMWTMINLKNVFAMHHVFSRSGIHL